MSPSMYLRLLLTVLLHDCLCRPVLLLWERASPSMHTTNLPERCLHMFAAFPVAWATSWAGCGEGSWSACALVGARALTLLGAWQGQGRRVMVFVGG